MYEHTIHWILGLCTIVPFHLRESENVRIARRAMETNSGNWC